MEQQHEWLFDLAKVSAEAKLPAGQDAARAEGTKPRKPGAQRSPAQVLAQLAFLKGLTPAQVQKILKCCAVGSYASGAEVCAIDIPSDEMYILLSGELAVLTRDGTRALTISPVTTVGELGFMTNCRRPVGLVATAASKVLRLSRFHFDHLMQGDPEIQVRIYRNVIDILSNKLIKLRDLVEGALTRAGELPKGS